MYRTESPEAEVLRLRDQLDATLKDRDALMKDRDALRAGKENWSRRLRGIATLVIAAIPPALVIRYHAPSRVLILDVLVFAVWGWLVVRASRRDPR